MCYERSFLKKEGKRESYPVTFYASECLSMFNLYPQEGQSLEPVNIGPKLQSPVQSPLQRLPTVVATSQNSSPGVEVECFRPEPRKSRLKVRAISQGYSGKATFIYKDVFFSFWANLLCGKNK